jgi:hypothetical protein
VLLKVLASGAAIGHVDAELGTKLLRLLLDTLWPQDGSPEVQQLLKERGWHFGVDSGAARPPLPALPPGDPSGWRVSQLKEVLTAAEVDHSSCMSCQCCCMCACSARPSCAASASLQNASRVPAGRHPGEKNATLGLASTPLQRAVMGPFKGVSAQHLTAQRKPGKPSLPGLLC